MREIKIKITNEYSLLHLYNRFQYLLNRVLSNSKITKATQIFRRYKQYYKYLFGGMSIVLDTHSNHCVSGYQRQITDTSENNKISCN